MSNSSESRYLIGLDLGTTNSCVAYVDRNLEKNPSLGVQLFKIPQANREGLQEALSTLPSFCFLKDEETVVGSYAKELGASVPTRSVQSAKSWLCNTAAARRERILPLEPAHKELQISPVEATAAYLRHIREAWNQQIGKGDPEQEFEAQELVLTVPASFDEVARRLTVEAARLAGYQKLTLLEEPQAAFYAWIGRHEKEWEEHLPVGKSVLVVDIGGGTSDFSLIDVVEGPALRRMAVGRHLLLGGDNMDEALCHLLEKKIGQKLDSGQWHQLRHQARNAKEALLGGAESFSVVLQGSGSSLMKGSLTASLLKEEAIKLLQEGFFPQQSLERSRQIRKGGAIRTVGLPYEEEPAITKHLSCFLEKAPDYVLFNGGTMKPLLFRESLLDAIEEWFGQRPEELPSECLDLAVARGAAYFGKVRNGLGTRIEGGSPRAYYLGVLREGVEEAITLLPRGAQEGSEVRLDKRFFLTPNQPVSFTIYTSQTRLNDKTGELVTLDEEQLQALPPLQTLLRFGKRSEPLPVRIFAKLTDIGTMEVWLESEISDHRWQLEFQLRSASGQDDELSQTEERVADETFEAGHLEGAKELIHQAFQGELPPSQLMRRLEQELERDRWKWPPSLLRGLFDLLITHGKEKGRSADHEARWWNAVGFCLRPGFGVPLDDHRIRSLWGALLAKTKGSKIEPMIQRAICIRRVACGLNKGQQLQLFAELSKGKSNNEMLNQEVIRTLGALEWADPGKKKKLGNELVERIAAGRGSEADLWALARIGTRQPLRGSVTTVLPPTVVEPWVEKLLPRLSGDQDDFAFCLQQICKRSDVRELNVREELTELVGTSPVDEESEQTQLYGEALPVGLMVEV